ncbi:MAG: hypothetical protein IJ433_02030 [Ruminococcus sp.]|nr:hypothetical protein [Ruminococcus sp.]
MSSNDFQNDKLIVSKAKDTVYLSQKRFNPCFYGFLNEHEVRVIRDCVHLEDDCSFFGGYEGAQRLVFGAGVSSFDEFPIVALKFLYKKEFELTHRDFLGSLMALGIERSTVGDILVFDGEAIVFVKEEIAEYIKQEVTKIGRVGVKILEQDIQSIDYVAEFDEITFTASSLRIDIFVASLCHVSREKAQQLIKSDLVTLNHVIENNASKTLCVDDIITIRKFGKFMFAEDSGFSKKGKHKVLVKHFR